MADVTPRAGADPRVAADSPLISRKRQCVVVRASDGSALGLKVPRNEKKKKGKKERRRRKRRREKRKAEREKN